MASLMEELIDTLDKENLEYEKLLALSMRKSTVIAARDIAELEKITDEEQIVVSNITRLENKRTDVTNDIANVINKDVESLKLSVLIELMAKQPKEQKKLSEVHDKLKATVGQVKTLNESNQKLIEESLEMIQFDMNLLRSMRQAPQTANYGRNAVSAGAELGAVKGFDAKQ